mmetsp:Transcript_66234/g.149527  ORF Transcript_66234/g.149527 Transcript_66234/m.149527 type:complete len:155 (+) Transcript_66234:319-783(+)
MTNCRLDGELSKGFLAGASNLRLLFCAQNQLCGPLHGEAGLLTLLQELDLSRNRLTGLLPVEVPSRLKQLQRLNLSYNQLRGRLPTTLMDLTACTELDLSNNFFNGRIPIGIAALKRTLTHCDISENNWTEEERAELGEFLHARLAAAAPNVFV